GDCPRTAQPLGRPRSSVRSGKARNRVPGRCGHPVVAMIGCLRESYSPMKIATWPYVPVVQKTAAPSERFSQSVRIRFAFTINEKATFAPIRFGVSRFGL